MAILLYLCQILVYWMWKRGVDPDNAAIPYLTAVIYHITTKHVQYHIIYHTVNFSTFDQSAQKLNHKLNVIWFSPQIGDLLGTSLLAMAFLALEEMGIYGYTH